MARVCFDVGGQIFTIRKDLIDSGPPSHLTALCNGVDVTETDLKVIIDRPVDLFQAILTLYQTGELHMPMTSCPGVFLKELEFWGIQPEMLQSCCMYRLQLFLDEQQTLNKFRENVMKGDGESMLASCMPGLEGIRAKIWAIIDFRENSIWAKIYFIVVLIMVLLSIFAIAYSTEQSFQRNMTNCERYDYMEAAETENFNLISQLLREHCQESEIPKPNTTWHVSGGGNESGTNLDCEDQYDYECLTVPDAASSSSEINAWLDAVESSLNQSVSTLNHLLNGSGIDQHELDNDTTTRINFTRVKVPNMKVPIFAIVLLDMITLAFFTVEIVIRLLACPSILRYFMSVINVADAAALIGAYLHIIIENIHKQEKYQHSWMDVFDYVQMLRSIRLFRIVKNLRTSRVLVYSFKMNLADLCAVAVYLFVGVCTFSSCVYLLEGRQQISSIPEGWYWAMITMTTVGYGDISLITPWGKFVACLCAISGVLLFALTVPIFATHFLTLYRYAGLEKTFSATKITRRFNASSRIGGNDPKNQPAGAPVQIPMENYGKFDPCKTNKI